MDMDALTLKRDQLEAPGKTLVQSLDLPATEMQALPSDLTYSHVSRDDYRYDTRPVGTLGLVNCVGITVWDPTKQEAGVFHYSLETNPDDFAAFLSHASPNAEIRLFGNAFMKGCYANMHEIIQALNHLGHISQLVSVNIDRGHATSSVVIDPKTGTVFKLDERTTRDMPFTDRFAPEMDDKTLEAWAARERAKRN